MPFELHNGNTYALVFWKGKLMKIEDAPKILNKKYYSKYQGREGQENASQIEKAQGAVEK